MRQFQEALRLGAGNMNTWLTAREEELKHGLRQTQRTVDAYRREAERAAHSAQRVVASRAEALVQVVASRSPPRPAARPTPAPRPSSPSSPSTPVRRPAPAQHFQAVQTWLGEATDQTVAAARGAQDAFTFGLGDHLVAGAMAVGDAMQGGDISASYLSRMDQERARDAEDSRDYPAARATGQVLGVGAQVLIPGAILGRFGALLVPASQGARIAQTAPLILRETAALAGAGGAVGIAGQAVDDVTNLKIGTLGDYGGAVVGGTLGALAARRGNVAQASAAAGLTQSVAQDTLNGGLNAQSATRARESAVAGATVGGLVGAGVAKHMDGLPMNAKGPTGEHISRIRNFVRGDKTGPANKTRHNLPGGGYTLPDLRTYRNGAPRQLIESKFGRSANLTPRQRQAARELNNYRVDHSTPRDIGAALGLPLSVIFPWDWAMTKPPSHLERTAP